MAGRRKSVHAAGASQLHLYGEVLMLVVVVLAVLCSLYVIIQEINYLLHNHYASGLVAISPSRLQRLIRMATVGTLSQRSKVSLGSRNQELDWEKCQGQSKIYIISLVQFQNNFLHHKILIRLERVYPLNGEIIQSVN